MLPIKRLYHPTGLAERAEAIAHALQQINLPPWEAISTDTLAGVLDVDRRSIADWRYAFPASADQPGSPEPEPSGRYQKLGRANCWRIDRTIAWVRNDFRVVPAPSCWQIGASYIEDVLLIDRPVQARVADQIAFMVKDIFRPPYRMHRWLPPYATQPEHWYDDRDRCYR